MTRELTKNPKPTHFKIDKWRGLFLFIFVILIVGGLVAISKVEYEVRMLESQYYQALKLAVKADEERGRLRLEKQHLTAPARVEHIAKTELNMTLDKSNYQTIYLMPVLREENRVQETQGE